MTCRLRVDCRYDNTLGKKHCIVNGTVVIVDSVEVCRTQVNRCIPIDSDLIIAYGFRVLITREDNKIVLYLVR